MSSPRRLERHADLQHLQQLEHEHCGGGTDCLYSAAQRQRVPGLLGPRSGCRQRQELPADWPYPVIDATPFTWTVDSGTLPPGLSLSSGGAITGTPTAAGTFNFTLKLVDSTGLTATQAQTITIAPDCAPPPTTTTPPTPPTTPPTPPTPHRIRLPRRGDRVLVIRKVANKHAVRGGKRIQFTITIRARGRGTATNVWVCDVLPPDSCSSALPARPSAAARPAGASRASRPGGAGAIT